jgi:hypothetical protein
MMMRKALFAVLLAGCASESDGPEILPGFTIDPPAQGEVQLVTPILENLTPGIDVQLCTYLDYVTTSDWDISRYKGMQSLAGHHNILYSVKQMKPPGTHECTDDDMVNVGYVGGGGSDGTVAADQLPPGIVFRVKAGTQLMIVSHWINATDQTLRGQAAYNVKVDPPSPDHDPADLFTIANTRMEIPVGGGAVHTECHMKEAKTMFMVGPHAHEWGTHVTVTKTSATGTRRIIQDIDWNKEMIFNTPLVKFTKEEPFKFEAGDTFGIDCQYKNDTGAVIQFPTEMCIAYGYFFPATQEEDCVDDNWPQ